MKALCDKCCKKIAVWWYMPADGHGNYCDDCVPRGCFCNVNPSTGIEDIDEKGRHLPCCEFGYAERGIYLDEA